MSGVKRYDEEFKQSLVNLYQTGKIQSELCKDHGVSQTALSKWILSNSLRLNLKADGETNSRTTKPQCTIRRRKSDFKKASTIFMQNSK